MSHLLIQGDARRIPLADGSVHTVVTSPPYFSLRDYGTARWVGGDAGCDHKLDEDYLWSQTYANSGFNSQAQKRSLEARLMKAGCPKCGATRVDSQLGLEATPDAYVAAMVRVFREVWRVLHDTGTVWCNLGDGFGPGKQLLMMPHRVALALQADGWIVRMDIVYSKPNPMPESVTDRPTKSHEYIFLLSKRERYFFDSNAVREKHLEPWRGNGTTTDSNPKGGQANCDDMSYGRPGLTRASKTTVREYNPAGRNIRSVWTIPSEAYPGAHFATFPRKLVAPCIKAGTSAKGVCPTCGAPWERVTENGDIKPLRGNSTAGPKAASGELFGRMASGYAKSGWTPGISQISTLGWRPNLRSRCDTDSRNVSTRSRALAPRALWRWPSGGGSWAST